MPHMKNVNCPENKFANLSLHAAETIVENKINKK